MKTSGFMALAVLALIAGCTKEQAVSSVETLGRGLCEGADNCSNRCPDGTDGSRYPSGYDCGNPYRRMPEKRGP